MNTHYVGVDLSAGAWLTVAYSDENEYPNVKVFEEIHRVWDEFGKVAHRIFVDVPIGLCKSPDANVVPCEEEDGKLSRCCDGLARAVIGPR